MKKYFILLAFLLSTIAIAQKKTTELKITYLRSSNGKLIENQEPILVFTSGQTAFVSNEKIISGNAKIPNEDSMLDLKSKRITQFAQIGPNKFIATRDSTFFTIHKLELLPETKKILGYNCKKAKAIINSNTIEIWYTTEADVWGGPSALGADLGLVLETNRNGNFVVSATKIEKVKKHISRPTEKYRFLDAVSYRDVMWKSRFTTIEIFKKEIINFSDDARSNDSVMRFANGAIAVRKIRMPEIAKNSQVFVDVTEQSNGDAYDRTGSIFLIPTDKAQSFLDGLNGGIAKLPIYENGNGKQYQGVVATENYTPLVELMRFFTPFGVSKYNSAVQLKNKTWQDSVLYRQDITDFLPMLSGKEVYIGINIGNYDKGGHKASVKITIHPELSATQKRETEIVPLFNTNNVMEMVGQEYGTMFSSDKGLEVAFTLPQPLKNVKLRYITTGHGGWENGDEYLKKKNTIYLDNKEVFAFVPWRTDCGSYRLSNPASGNFENGLSSSDESRSNWCPGTTTNPIWIDLGDLAAGKHNVLVKIPLGEREGTSFSSWNVSGVLLGEKF